MAIKEQVAGIRKHSAESLVRKGYQPEDAQSLSTHLGAHDVYRVEVTPRLKAAETLSTIADLLSAIKSYTMPDQQAKENLGSESVKRDILDLVEKSGADSDKASEIFFGNPGKTENGLLETLQNKWVQRGVLSTQRHRFEMGTEIIDALEKLYGNRQELSSLFSTEPVISQETTGGTRKVSTRELFIFNLDSFTRRMAKIERVVADAMLSNQDVATYAAYAWTRETAHKSAVEHLNVFPTPDTQAAKEQIRTAYSKRNGILKYILFGEAGVGKTRLIQTTDAELGKETVVINFHEFITFEELIGQTAMTVNLEGGSGNDKFVRIVERFGDMGSEDFWVVMENIYAHLPDHLRKQFDSTEDMVEQYGHGIVGGNSLSNGSDGIIEDDLQKSDSAEPLREKIKDRFQRRMKAIRDMSLLGFSDMSKESLQARWIQGAILSAMQSGKLVCFDEMDKAGPYAIEGLLSFLSLEPGMTWSYQGGSVKIPDDFYITATSNRSNIGALANSQEMNRFLADRSEQILVKPQSVKGSLMIAAVSLCDAKGKLLINEEEQMELVTVFSYILPRLQEANLSMPVTNRIIKTVCSRLVDYQETPDGNRRYFRTLNTDGRPQSVAEALKLSVLDMKGMSLTDSGKKKVQQILADYNALIGKEKIRQFGNEFDYFEPEEKRDKGKQREQELERRKDIVEAIWQQPIFQAIATLDAGVELFGIAPEEVSVDILGLKNVQDLVEKSGTLQQKTIGRRNGIALNPKGDGIYMQTHLPDSIRLLDEKLIVDGHYAGAVIKSADQLGNAFAVTMPDGIVKIFSESMERFSFSNDLDKPVIIDPLGEYVIYYDEDDGLNMRWDLSKQNQNSLSFNDREAEVIDITPNGNTIVVAKNGGLDIIAFDRDSRSNTVIPIDESAETTARFLSNNLLLLTSNGKQRAIVI